MLVGHLEGLADGANRVRNGANPNLISSSCIPFTHALSETDEGVNLFCVFNSSEKGVHLLGLAEVDPVGKISQPNAVSRVHDPVGTLSLRSVANTSKLSLEFRVDRMCEKRIDDMAQGRTDLDRFSEVSKRNMSQYCMTMRAFLTNNQFGDWTERPPQDVLDQLVAALEKSGQNITSYGPAARVCLGRGNEMNDPSIALAAALFMVGAGQLEASETIGLHLAGSTGTYQPSSVATAWLQRAYEVRLAKGEELLPSQAALVQEIRITVD